MAHSAGRSNGVVADENEMESECVFLLVDYAASDAGGGSQQYYCRWEARGMSIG